MEMEFFVKPGSDEEWHERWIQARMDWYRDLGVQADNLRLYEHPADKRSHYSKRTVDIEYRYGFQGSEWGELEGIANRTDFDLSTHAKASGQDMSYLDPESNERFVPYVIEPAAGVDRSMLAFLLDAYAEDEAPDAKGALEKRTVLRLDHRLAPVKIAVLPLSRNADLSPKARDVAATVRRNWNCRLRRRRRDRPQVPPPGRDRDAVLRDRRLRQPRRSGRHGPRAGHHEAGADRDRQPDRLPVRAAGRLLARVENDVRSSRLIRWHLRHRTMMGAPRRGAPGLRTGEVQVSEALILEFSGLGEKEYKAVNDQLGIDMQTGAGDWPQGLITHAAGPGENGTFVVTEVWNSRADQAAFMESRLGAALAAGGVTSAPSVRWIPLIAFRTPGI